MCHVYAGAAPSAYAGVTRSLRLHGAVTSVRLEARFWDILDEMAAAEGLSTARFVGTLHDEVLELRGEVANLASLLRVACAIYLAGGGRGQGASPAPPATASAA